jgi:hypothetical protein
MIRFANTGMGGLTNVQQRLFAVQMPRMLFTLFNGYVHMGLLSQFVLGGMTLQGEPCAKVES